MAWAWYPAAGHAEAHRADDLPAPWAPNAQFLGLEVDGVHAHSLEGAPLADGAASYPVVLMSLSGFPPLLLASLAEELASHRYVVVGVNHTYESTVTVFNDGRVVPMKPEAVAGALGPQSGSHEQAFRARADVRLYKAADLAFVAGRVALLADDPAGHFGRLDLDRMGVVGLSFGGNAALEWCRTDPRGKAAVNLDGAIRTDVGKVGLERPALQILAEHEESSVWPAKAVETSMAPDLEWFVTEKEITFKRVAHRARAGRARLHGARRWSHPPQLPGCALAAA